MPMGSVRRGRCCLRRSMNEQGTGLRVWGEERKDVRAWNKRIKVNKGEQASGRD